MKRKAAFTLIELIIVVIIVGIIAVSAVPIYRLNLRRTYSAEGFATLGAIRRAQHLYKAEHGRYVEVTGAPGETIYDILELDTADNRFWNNPAFRVEVPDPARPGDTFLATATGANSTAPGAAHVDGIILTMNEKGETTGP